MPNPTWLDELTLPPTPSASPPAWARASSRRSRTNSWPRPGPRPARSPTANQRRADTLGRDHRRPAAVAPCRTAQGAPGQDDEALWRLAAPAQCGRREDPRRQPHTGVDAFARGANQRRGRILGRALTRRLTRSRGASARRSALLRKKVGAATASTASTDRCLSPYSRRWSSACRRPRLRQRRRCVAAHAPNSTLRFAATVVASAARRPSFEIGAEPLLLQLWACTVAPGVATATLAPRLRIQGDDGPQDLPDLEADPGVPPPPHLPPPPRVDSEHARAFRAAAQRHLQLANPARCPVLVLSQLLTTQRLTVQAQLDPAHCSFACRPR